MKTPSTMDKIGKSTTSSHLKYSQFSPLRVIEPQEAFDDQLKIDDDDEEDFSDCSSDDEDFIIENDEVNGFEDENISNGSRNLVNVTSTDLEDLEMSALYNLTSRQ